MPADAESVTLAAKALRAGEIVAFATETVYGLGADASNDEAVAKVFKVKGRPGDHPLIVHLLTVDEIDEWAVEISEEARDLAYAFWPGPLTIVFKRSAKASDAVTGGLETVALRVPSHPVARALLSEFGGAIAAPSANRFGRVSPTSAEAVCEDLGDDVEIVLDGGPSRVGLESTIIDCSGDDITVLRPGGVTLDRIDEVLGYSVAVGGETRSPGTLEAHYAPKARVEIVTARDAPQIARDHLENGRKVALLAPPPVPIGLPTAVGVLEPPETDEEYARVLYDRLRTADHHRIDVVLAVLPVGSGIGLAVADRLTRAAASK